MKHLLCRSATRGFTEPPRRCRPALVLSTALVSVIIAGLFLVGLFAGVGLVEAAPAPAPSPAAIEPETEYAPAIMDLTLHDIANVPGDPSIGLTDAVTRAQMAVYLTRALKLPESQYSDFLDVEPTDWGSGAITALHRAKLMDGTSPLTFSPDEPVSRQEAAALILGALRYAVQKHGAQVADTLSPYHIADWLAGFRDRNIIGNAYVASVAIAYRAGLFDLPVEGWLFPALSLTQQEFAPMLRRAFLEPVVTRASLPAPADPVDSYPKLSRGAKGPLVLLLESRLTTLNYPCGPVDGTYDYRTRDAVLAFEKYERLKRTGVVDGTVWERLLSASAPVPVYDKPGRRIEVDLTRQVLMMIVDDKVLMTIHVSTGKYGTPTGTWHIRTRTKGWRPTSLGPIWSPAYFMAKNAIHGYPSVPTYPASHGCVRTPIWIQNSLIDQIELGMPVDVFYNKAR